MVNSFKPVTGIILAGGKSSRMGFDKGMAPLQGKPMVAWVINTLQLVCNHIIIISNNEDYQQLGFPVYADIYKDSGPLGGIFTGLTHSSTDYNLVMACDIPYVTSALLTHLLTFATNYSLVVPSINGRFEPLCAFYHKHTHATMAELIKQNTRKMQHVIRQFNFKEIKLEDLGIDSHMFANINTPEQLQQHQTPGTWEE